MTKTVSPVSGAFVVQKNKKNINGNKVKMPNFIFIVVKLKVLKSIVFIQIGKNLMNILIDLKILIMMLTYKQQATWLKIREVLGKEIYQKFY